MMTLQLLTSEALLTTMAAVAFLFICFKLVRTSAQATHTPYPPGPPAPSSILGHFRKLPTKKPWFDYMEMGKVYGKLPGPELATQCLFSGIQILIF
jgi:hypothetical protein